MAEEEKWAHRDSRGTLTGHTRGYWWGGRNGTRGRDGWVWPALAAEGFDSVMRASSLRLRLRLSACVCVRLCLRLRLFLQLGSCLGSLHGITPPARSRPRSK